MTNLRRVFIFAFAAAHYAKSRQGRQAGEFYSGGYDRLSRNSDVTGTGRLYGCAGVIDFLLQQ
jgi:hypothetical protein